MNTEQRVLRMLSEHADLVGVTIADFETDDDGAIIRESLPYCMRNLLSCIYDVEYAAFDRLTANTHCVLILEPIYDKSLVDYYGLTRKYCWPYGEYDVTLVECL